MQQQPTPKAETLDTEPEIIPPDTDWPSSSRIWVSTGPHHTTRIQIRRWVPSALPSLCCWSGFWLSLGWCCCSEPLWSELS